MRLRSRPLLAHSAGQLRSRSAAALLARNRDSRKRSCITEPPGSPRRGPRSPAATVRHHRLIVREPAGRKDEWRGAIAANWPGRGWRAKRGTVRRPARACVPSRREDHERSARAHREAERGRTQPESPRAVCSLASNCMRGTPVASVSPSRMPRCIKSRSASPSLSPSIHRSQSASIR